MAEFTVTADLVAGSYGSLCDSDQGAVLRLAEAMDEEEMLGCAFSVEEDTGIISFTFQMYGPGVGWIARHVCNELVALFYRSGSRRGFVPRLDLDTLLITPEHARYDVEPHEMEIDVNVLDQVREDITMTEEED